MANVAAASEEPDDDPKTPLPCPRYIKTSQEFIRQAPIGEIITVYKAKALLAGVALMSEEHILFPDMEYDEGTRRASTAHFTSAREKLHSASRYLTEEDHGTKPFRLHCLSRQHGTWIVLFEGDPRIPEHELKRSHTSTKRRNERVESSAVAAGLYSDDAEFTIVAFWATIHKKLALHAMEVAKLTEDFADEMLKYQAIRRKKIKK